ncbi:MAG: hypothetical protein HYU66_25460, partial [Armatimonadetes bacterium]|nr:hypothetical protein [Armatimonadota bacterium]
QGARLTTHLKVDNDTPFSVWRTRTPLVALAPLGARAENDTLCCPNGPGVLYRNPIGRNAGRSGVYPDGWWTMQWTAWFDRSGGVFLGALDPEASQKSWSARGSSGDNALHQTVDWPMPGMGTAGNDWDQPGVGALEVFRGDWYDAALIYRRWCEASAAWWPARNPAKHTPDSMRDVAVWAQTGGSARECVDRVIGFARFMGVPTAFHWYSWHQIPFDVQYPHYDPPKDGMADGVKALEAAGVRVMPYINARLWDTALDDFKAEANKAATCDEAGKPYIEEYGSGAKLAPMCPTTTLWQDKVRSIVLWIQNDLGTSGVYLDQVAAAAPRLCFNPDHGHPLGGGDWWTVSGYWPLLSKLRGSMAPGKFITTECNAEPYVQYFDGYLTWHWQEQDMVPAFSAVYADQVVFFSRAYDGDDLAVRMKAAQQLCFGEQLGWIDPAIVRRAAGAFMRRCAQMRSQLNDYIARGQMRRPPEVTGDVPALTADWKWGGSRLITMRALQTAAWQAGDGRLVLLFANFSPAAVEVEYRFRPEDYGFAPNAAVSVVRRASDGALPARRLSGAWTASISAAAEDVVAFEVTPAK